MEGGREGGHGGLADGDGWGGAAWAATARVRRRGPHRRGRSGRGREREGSDVLAAAGTGEISAVLFLCLSTPHHLWCAAGCVAPASPPSPHNCLLPGRAGLRSTWHRHNCPAPVPRAPLRPPSPPRRASPPATACPSLPHAACWCACHNDDRVGGPGEQGSRGAPQCPARASPSSSSTIRTPGAAVTSM